MAAGMNRKYLGLIAVGCAFLAIGYSGRTAFIGIGFLFIMIGIVKGRKEKRNFLHSESDHQKDNK